MSDEFSISPLRAGLQHVEASADALDVVEIRELVVCAHVVNLTRETLFENQRDCTAEVRNMNPGADLKAAPVNRNWFAGERFLDHARRELLGVLTRSVVIRAAYGDDGHAVCPGIGAAELILRSLACRIGTARIKGRFFDSGRCVLRQEPVDLIG